MCYCMCMDGDGMERLIPDQEDEVTFLVGCCHDVLLFTVRYIRVDSSIPHALFHSQACMLFVIWRA